ncbi:pimeloyl-ACP methyl ester carboxylesterase [Crossiella equi]|uniref:Pimeloyl-ACP methyl ester carboxylesterase n=1 Tax=Crossiella equi TaxID=130796 RepID=A0ABS5ASL2_9PSEU|nr:alpha/beta hydrolase [Crossiella equi]MBP2479421.1 pimeloyl-ACP methyl ester carboxylesterase [Crossiella equi]
MHLRHQWRRGLALAAAVGLAAAAAPVTAQAAPSAQVEWRDCPPEVAAKAPTLRCATVPVPLDYADPGGTKINLTISKAASPEPARRRGILLTNPGGPGGSGLTLPGDLLSLGLPSSVAERYDIIGMDTRGVGHSTPVSCGFTDDGAYFGNVPPYAEDDAAVVKRAEVAEAVAKQCQANDRDGRLRHLTTANNARDLDQIRIALGEPKASYLGYSYGTALGAAYASMFPGTTDRVVLDSNLGGTALDRDGMRRFALGTEQTFPDFAKWAAARHGSYGLGRTQAEVRGTFDTITQRLAKEPVAGFDNTLFRMVTFGGLYRESSYGRTAALWQSLLRADAQEAQRLLGERKTGGELSAHDNAWTVFLAVTCNDVKWPTDLAAYREGVAEDRVKYPIYGAATANVLPCAYWPFERTEPQVPVNDNGPRNVLVVQNLRDPATPIEGGRLMREKFAQRSKLVTVDGSGHGVYVFGENPCALNTTTTFLTGGGLPARDVSCGAATVSGLVLDEGARQRRAELLAQRTPTP